MRPEDLELGGGVCEWGLWSLTAALLPCHSPRSRSRSGDWYRRGGRGPRHHSSSHSRSSWSLSPSRSRSLTRSRSPSPSPSPSRSPSRSRSHSHSQSHSPSPPREKLTRPAASPAVGEKLKKTEPAAGKETGAAKVTQADAAGEAEAEDAEGTKQAVQGG